MLAAVHCAVKKIAEFLGEFLAALACPDRPSLQAEGVHLAVPRADINHPIRHGGRGLHNVAGGVAPQLVPAAGL